MSQDIPLYEVSHPYYGAEAERDYHVEFETLDELEKWLDAYDEDMNFVYRWDWTVPLDEDIAGALRCGEDAPQEALTLYVVLQRKSRFVNLYVPVTAADEPRVRALLTSDRVLGALRRTWAPLLDQEWEPTGWWRAVAPDGSLWAESSNEDEVRERLRPGDTLQRHYVVTDTEWRTVQ
jgi:hypothetical protein